MSTAVDDPLPLAAAARPLVARRITWVSVAPGYFVASDDAGFVGSVDRTADGHFIAIDGHATPIGRYVTLDEAKRSFLTTVTPRNDARRRRTRDRAKAATVTGAAIAGALALTAGAVVPFV